MSEDISGNRFLADARWSPSDARRAIADGSIRLLQDKLMLSLAVVGADDVPASKQLDGVYFDGNLLKWDGSATLNLPDIATPYKAVLLLTAENSEGERVELGGCVLVVEEAKPVTVVFEDYLLKLNPVEMEGQRRCSRDGCGSVRQREGGVN